MMTPKAEKVSYSSCRKIGGRWQVDASAADTAAFGWWFCVADGVLLNAEKVSYSSCRKAADGRWQQAQQEQVSACCLCCEQMTAGTHRAEQSRQQCQQLSLRKALLVCLSMHALRVMPN
jgi:hypothetical protein